jgi:SHS2 domain-containing protein
MTRREHVGELRFELAAASAEGLFEQAAALLAAEEAPEAGRDAPWGDPVEIGLEAEDMAGLLVDWVNELIYLTETQGCALPHARVDELSERSLRATAWPVQARVRHAVKAATLHGVEVRRGADGWRASLLVDV